ncbi:hypothetical protein J3R97_11500 [Enterococcus faecium]|nr:hypothetical protein [Enterococcus faecium]
MGTGFIDRVLVQVKEERKKGRKEERKITMKYNLLDHKRMLVEKLEEDLEQLELLGHNKTSTVYKEGLKRTKKAQKELATLESSVQKKEVDLTYTYL